MLQGSTTAAMERLNPGLAAFQSQVRRIHPDAVPSLPGPGPHPLGAAFPLHPAFPLQGYPFYPGGLLAALRQGPALQTAPDSPPNESKYAGGKSFTIDAILGGEGRTGDEDEDGSEERRRAPRGGRGQEDVRALTENASVRPGRLDIQARHYPPPGMPQCPTAFRYGGFNPGCRSEKKTGHVTGNGWKGKSKRVRTIFTPEQLERLETEFERQQYMVGTERYYLAASLNLTEAQVKVWFQNRRIKWRKQNLEQQHAKLAHFELFSSEEVTDSDAESPDRKLPSPEVAEVHDDVTRDVTGEHATTNRSFDSGISVDNSKCGMLPVTKDGYPILYVNSSTMASHNSQPMAANTGENVTE